MKSLILLSVLVQMTLAAPPEPSPARVADLTWMVGVWTGDGLGGAIEEAVFPALGGAMPSTFRLVRDGDPVFYEFMLYEDTDAGVRLRLHHFNPGLTRWEDEPVEFLAARVREGEAIFEEKADTEERSRLRYTRQGNTLRAELTELRDGRDTVTARFVYTLADDPS